MPIRTITQLKEWFRKGCYPKEEHFADLFDSYFHKEEGDIKIARIKELPETLNDKYQATDGKELESKVSVLRGDFDSYREQTDTQLDNIVDNLEEIEELDERQQGEIDTLQTRLDDARADIDNVRDMIAAGASLDEAKAALAELGSGYSTLLALAGTLKTFLEAGDTADNTINTWREIESFLQGVTDTESLTALLSNLETTLTAAYNAAVTAERERAEGVEADLYGKLSGDTTTDRIADGAVTAEKIAAGVIPTTLPASDVSAWAKAPKKPTYNFNEIQDAEPIRGAYESVRRKIVIGGGTNAGYTTQIAVGMQYKTTDFAYGLLSLALGQPTIHTWVDYIFTAGGDIIAPGNYYTSSDERLKDFVGDLHVDWDAIKSLPKKYYRFKKDKSGAIHIGTSAQELLKSYPELVNEDAEGMLSVDYAKLSVIALAAVSELEERLTKLESKIMQ
ncbi:MAG: tail fiber domain-containing protein [Rikenellaceae bacterium]|nr:tail fiber domain-containing protein [Rikenellaceae bacterium]